MSKKFYFIGHIFFYFNNWISCENNENFNINQQTKEKLDKNNLLYIKKKESIQQDELLLSTNLIESNENSNINQSIDINNIQQNNNTTTNNLNYSTFNKNNSISNNSHNISLITNLSKNNDCQIKLQNNLKNQNKLINKLMNKKIFLSLLSISSLGLLRLFFLKKKKNKTQQKNLLKKKKNLEKFQEAIERLNIDSQIFD
jgi:hypothetical protein